MATTICVAGVEPICLCAVAHDRLRKDRDQSFAYLSKRALLVPLAQVYREQAAIRGAFGGRAARKRHPGRAQRGRPDPRIAFIGISIGYCASSEMSSDTPAR